MTDYVKNNVAYHNELNSKAWDNNQLRPEVNLRLLEIAQAFIGYLEIPEFKISDIVLTGSMANYNYTRYSDFDIHVVTDYADLNADHVVEAFYRAKKEIWNNYHDITIYGHEAELYIEDEKVPPVAGGMYSLLRSEWIKQPKYNPPSIDEHSVNVKVKDLVKQIDRAVNSKDAEDIKRLKDRIRVLRRSGLDKAGEFGVENVSFKILRNMGYLDQLNQAYLDVQDRALSLEEVAIDNVNGAGAVPYNKDVDYFGVRVDMKPSVFLKLAAPLGQEHSAELEKYIANGGAIGAPFLDIKIPPEWDDGVFGAPAQIVGHEGRNRMTAILKLEGDAPIEVHLFPKGGYRGRDMTADYISSMNKGMVAERSSNLITGPLFNAAVAEHINEDPITLKGPAPDVKAWIEKVYAKYPQTWQNNHVMPMGGSGDDQQFAMFELVPSLSRRGAVEVKWIQAYPLRQGVGSRAMKMLQDLARKDNIGLTLYPWDKGQVSQSKLIKFYKSQGFTPASKGSKNMSWVPESGLETISEIDRWDGNQYTGGKKVLRVGAGIKDIKKLPGNNEFVYSTESNQFDEGIIIKLWDSSRVTPEPVQLKDEDDYEFSYRMHDWKRTHSAGAPGTLIAKLVLTNASGFPLKGALQVDSITVDEDYRGKGIAKSLYGIVLSILHKPLLAGASQTPGGRRNWLSMNRIPGVEIKGYVTIPERLLQRNNISDTIMGKLGGQYIGKNGNLRFFAFDVVPGTDELKPAVDTALSQIYDSEDYKIGLYAKWHGTVTEAETDTEHANQIEKEFTALGYKQLGSGADSTVWAKDKGHIIKILMPEDAGSRAEQVFIKFYEFCKAHQNLTCLPVINEHNKIDILGKEYTQIDMERLSPIKKNSFNEGVVWFFSDFVAGDESWDAVDHALGLADTWTEYNPRQAAHLAKYWQDLTFADDHSKFEELHTLYGVMQILYKAGRINKFGWDLHTENVMQRKNGQLVIIDPWFADSTLNESAAVTEARTNPEQNTKYESGMKELEAVAKTIADPENWAISMTSEPKLGINPQVGISEDTPKGIYFYPLNYAVGMIKGRRPLPWGDNYPYIQLFQYDRSGEMTQQTQVDSEKLKQALRQYCSDEIIQQALDEPEYDGTPYWTIYDCLSRLGKSDETNVVRWNKVLRDLGFTSVYDPGKGWIAYNEPTQGVVLDPRIIKQLKTIVNKQQSSVVTPAKIEQAIFEAMDMELARNRAWQAYDPDGSKLRAAAKEYAKDPKFKPWMGKPGTEELYDKASGLGRWGAVQLGNEAWAWFKAQQQPVKQESVEENFVNYQGLRPPKNVPGTNLFPGQDIVGQRVYHCTNRLEAIKKSGGLKPRRDATGEREYGRLSTDEHPFIPVIGIWFSVGKPDWPGKHCVSFVIEPTDQVYVAYANTKGLKPNVVLNPIALDRLTVEGQQDVAENFADGKGPGRAGDSQRHGIPKGATMAELEKASHAGGRKGQLARWQLNMRRGRKHANEGVVAEGGWASTATQNTVITPKIVSELVNNLGIFAHEYNFWQAQLGLDTEIKMGRPKGSGTYYERDLKQDPEREYGDVDVECFIHSRPDVGSAARIAEYRNAILEFTKSNNSYSTDNGTNVIMDTSAGPAQVDLIFTFHEHAHWSPALSPEYRVKGVISSSLTSSLAEVLNLSFSTQGLQVKTRNGQPVSFRQSKDTKLQTVSLSPETWAVDIYKFYYSLANGNIPKNIPADLKTHSGLKDEQRLSDIVMSIRSLASALNSAGLLGRGALSQVADQQDLMRQVAQVYDKKLTAAEGSSKFDKAATPAAQAKADKTRLMLAKYRNEISKLLLN